MDQHVKLDADIEALDDDIEDMTEEDFERVIKGNSREALALRRARREVRYRLARIQTMVLGGPDAEDTENLKEQFEAMPLFSGWRWYGINWDVDLFDPYQIISREHSQVEEWEALIAQKFPRLTPGGGVQYPDLKVKKKVEENYARLKAEGRIKD